MHQDAMRTPNSILVRTCSQAPNNTRAADAGVHDGYNVAEFALERRVKVGAALDCSQAVAVGQLGEDADIAVVLELKT